MIGTTLTEIHEHIESLASDNGEYYLVCARYGDCPVPASDLRFDTRETAIAAAEATTQYRQTLRRYDPQVPYYDIIVCQVGETQTRNERIGTCCGSTSSYPASLSKPAVTRSPIIARDVVEFCHHVVAAVFETLSEHGYDAVESAIMDAYFAHAEDLSDPDGLCIRLLESMAVELSDQLDGTEQVTFLSGAASRLKFTAGEITGSTTRPTWEESVDKLLSVLRDIGLFRRGVQVTETTAASEGSTELVIQISGYALQPHDGRLPLLPIALAIRRCDNAWVPMRIRTSADNWQIVFRPVSDPETLTQTHQVFAPEVR